MFNFFKYGISVTVIFFFFVQKIRMYILSNYDRQFYAGNQINLVLTNTGRWYGAFYIENISIPLFVNFPWGFGLEHVLSTPCLS